MFRADFFDLRVLQNSLPQLVDWNIFKQNYTNFVSTFGIIEKRRRRLFTVNDWIEWNIIPELSIVFYSMADWVCCRHMRLFEAINYF